MSVAGTLRQVAVGFDGAVWGVTPNDDIYYWAAGSWVYAAGKLRQIAVGSRTMIWGVDAAHQVFARDGNTWRQLPGALKQVSVAADGAVFGVTPNDAVVRWRGGGWDPVAAGVTSVAAASASNVWGTDAGAALFRSTGAVVESITQQRWTGDARQRWRLRPNGDGTFRIENAARVKVLTVSGGSTSAGAAIACEPWTGASHQRWKVEFVDETRVSIKALPSDLALTVDALDAGAGASQVAWSNSGEKRWRISEVVAPSGAGGVVTLWSDPYYQGTKTTLGVGAYGQDVLNKLPNPNFASVKVPLGLKVSLLGDQGFRGHLRAFSADKPTIPEYETEPVNSVVVEPVATFYRDPNFQGASIALGMGRINLSQTTLGDNLLSSLRVPSGVSVTLYSEPNFNGARRVYFEDASDLGDDWGDQASSVEIRVLGLMIPRASLRFGGVASIRGSNGKWLKITPEGVVVVDGAAAGPWEGLTIVRVGPTQHLSHSSYGDEVALRSAHGTYLRAVGGGLGVSSTVGAEERWTVVRSGPGTSSVFVSAGDVISLQSTATQTYLAVGGGDSAALVPAIDGATRWTVTKYTPPNLAGEATGPSASELCGANVCAAEACVADLCGAEACAADAALVSICTVAAVGVAVCAVDVAVLSGCGVAVGGIAACGADVCAAAACGAAACGAAACAADACGAAACAADACGAAACGVDVSPLGGCSANAGGIDVCPVDVCGANACGINACPADACAADACGLDVIPLIPFI